ncbi:sugar ABC transporter substrate-binding protein [Ruminococcus sp. 5_1_39BFAA]|uniref:ABC transporter substrate-binding protein n=1 Tax=Ruminococcus sp. 5_1_39BFAA TaxID=457412 RepID=UPI00356764B8
MKKSVSFAMALTLALTAVPATVWADDEVTTLTIWSPSDREAIEEWWTEKLAEWNEEHPEIQVSREAIDRSDSYAYDNKIATAVTSNDLPDIFYVDGPQVSYYAANGISVPLDDYFTEDDLSDFVPSTVAQCTYDGQLYAIGATESSVAFFYNKDYLTECGVDVEDLDSRTLENPITWAEMAEIAEKCTTDSYVGTHIIMDHGEGLPYALEPMYLSAGKDYISEDGAEAEGYVNSEEAVTTTAYLADLIAKGYANIDPIDDEFLNGACATMLGGSWEVATLEANADFEWGVTYYPVNDDTKEAVSPCGDWSAAISKDCENVEAAGEFLQWLMSTDNVATYAAAIAKPAARSSAYDNEAMADYNDGARALFVEQLENTAVPRPRTPSYATFSSAYAEAMTNILSDAATAEEVDTDYVQSELDTVAETFTEDYETYYAE